MWMIDIPSPFAPKSEMLAFLKDCERDKDDPKVKPAMAKVQGYLDAADRKAAGGPSRGDDVNGLTDHSIDAWRPALASLVARFRCPGVL